MMHVSWTCFRARNRGHGMSIAYPSALSFFPVTNSRFHCFSSSIVAHGCFHRATQENDCGHFQVMVQGLVPNPPKQALRFVSQHSLHPPTIELCRKDKRKV